MDHEVPNTNEYTYSPPLHLRLSEHCGMGVMVERLKPLEGQEVCLETVSFRYAHQISAL